MMKTLLRTVAGISIATFIFGTPPVYAVFGIRAARTVLAARKAKKMAAASTSEEASAQEKAKFGQPAIQKEQD